ncbi:16849_t:CDS:1, partial [Dentiscutata erythropus]
WKRDRNAYIFENFVLPYYEKNILPKYSYKEPFTRKELIDELSFWNIDIETFNIEICVPILANKIETLFYILQDIEKKITLFINKFNYYFWIDGVSEWAADGGHHWRTNLFKPSEYDGLIFNIMEYYGDKICKKIENIFKDLDCEVKLSREYRIKTSSSSFKTACFILSIKINRDILKSEVIKKLGSDYL